MHKLNFNLRHVVNQMPDVVQDLITVLHVKTVAIANTVTAVDHAVYAMVKAQEDQGRITQLLPERNQPQEAVQKQLLGFPMMNIQNTIYRQSQ
jgi:hypothetical protein